MLGVSMGDSGAAGWCFPRVKRRFWNSACGVEISLVFGLSVSDESSGVRGGGIGIAGLDG